MHALAELGSNFGDLTSSVDEFRTVRQKEIGCSFNETKCFSFVFLINSTHFLLFRAEGEYFGNTVSISVLFVVVSHSIGHLNECTFSFVTDLVDSDVTSSRMDNWISVGVVANT